MHINLLPINLFVLTLAAILTFKIYSTAVHFWNEDLEQFLK